jgi:CRP-like cAMP-binding protein
MYFQQSDLFWGMDKNFVKAVMDIATKESCAAGDFLFHTGDTAKHFYILLTGRVKLWIGETGQAAYSVDHAGEAFGWSSLVGLESYSASAECMKAATLQRFEREQFREVLENDPGNGLIFFKRMAGLIGNRLLWSYKMLTASEKAANSPSFGSEQVQASEAAV